MSYKCTKEVESNGDVSYIVSCYFSSLTLEQYKRVYRILREENELIEVQKRDAEREKECEEKGKKKKGLLEMVFKR